jgi:hypothetical protein
MEGVAALVACQHCGFEARGRVFCPQCRRKMGPAGPAKSVAADLAPDPCDACRRSPSGGARFFSVRSYVIFFRWRRFEQRLCRDCARNAFRDAQYECLTRGWWGLLLGPLATVLAVLRNVAAWQKIKRLPEPAAERWVADEPAVHRRPLVYVTTTAAATIAAFIAFSPVLGHHASTPAPVAIAQMQQALPTPADDPAPSTAVWNGALNRLAIKAPARWQREPDVPLSTKSLAKIFKHPSQTRLLLDSLNYQHGLDREFFRPSSRVVVEEQLWQFDTTDDADGWMLLWLNANEPHAGSTYRSSFPSHGGPDSRGYLARSRDHYGFSYGVAIARVDNVIIHVRYASLAAVSRADVDKWLTRAVRVAGGVINHR